MAKSKAVTPATNKGGGSMGPALATAAKLVFVVGSGLLAVAFVHREKTTRTQLRCDAAVEIARHTNNTDLAIAQLARELPESTGVNEVQHGASTGVGNTPPTQ